MKLVVLYLLVVPTARSSSSRRSSVVLDRAKSSILNPGPHGLSEVVYAFTSAANNNGSAFGGLTGNTDWFNTTLGLAMLAGRFLLIVPVLAIAGSLARKQPVPASAGTFPTGTPLFAALLVGVDRDRRRRSPTSPCSPSGRSWSSWACDLRRQPRRSSTRRSCGARPRQRAEARPAAHGAQPGDVRRRDRQRARDRPLRQGLPTRRTGACSPGSSRPGSGSRCCSRTSRRRSPRGAARPRPTSCARRAPTTIAHRRLPDGSLEDVAELALRVGDEVVVSAGEVIPADGDVDRGHRERRRVGDHRRVGARDPRVGRRPLGRHRRHAGALGRDRRPGHRAAGRELPRPDDRARRGRERQKTPNEIALNILLAGLTIVFLALPSSRCSRSPSTRARSRP